MSAVRSRRRSRKPAATCSCAHLRRPVTVVAGNASVMVGGDAAAFERAKPVMFASPQGDTHRQQWPACQMKIAVDLLLMVEVICFGEAVALAERGGVQRDVAVDAILKKDRFAGARLSRAVHLEGRSSTCRWPTSLAAEGHAACARARRKLGSPVPLAAAANEMMKRAAGSASTVRISSPRMKSTAALEDSHDIEGRDVRRRLGQGVQEDRREDQGGDAARENVRPMCATCPRWRASRATMAGSTCRCSS